MEHSEFHIGLEFWSGDRNWCCTDVGTRVITAICLSDDPWRAAVRMCDRSAPDQNQLNHVVETNTGSFSC
jgi:hypothetical protein